MVRQCIHIACAVMLLSWTAQANSESLTAENEELSVIAKWSEAPIIDGYLEPVWKTVTPVTDLRQAKPSPGASPSYETEVYTLYNENDLFIAFQCFEPDPELIDKRLQKRDRWQLSDLALIAIGPFGDQRNGYWFCVTAGGVQIDGAISNVDNYDTVWDGVWDSAVAINDSGWVAEMRIPFATFRHVNPEENGWTITFQRDVFRLEERDVYPVYDGRDRDIMLHEYVPMIGLEGIPSSSHLEVIPHAIARWDAPESADWRSQNTLDNIGGTAKWVVSPRWSMDMTYQPDFAQVEVDDEVINLSDYPVFLTEKRPFFLEGLDLFHESGVQLLYTRRIADPLYGARVTGQENQVRASGVYARNDDPNHGLEHTGAARTQMNIGERSTTGFTLTHLTRENFTVTSGGLDGAVRWGDRNEVVLNVAAVDKPDRTRQPLFMRADLFVVPVKNTEISYDLSYRGQDFDVNDLGWIGNSDQIWNWGRVLQKGFPEKGLVKRWSVAGIGSHQMRTNYNHSEGHFNLSGWINIDYEWYFGLEGGLGDVWRRNYVRDDAEPSASKEVLEDNFGRYIPEYHRTFQFGGWFETDSRQTWSYGSDWVYNSLRGGSRIEFSPFLSVTPRSNLLLNINFDWTRVWDVYDINDGNRTDFRILRIRGDWSPTLNTSLRTTIQFVDNTDDIDGMIANMVYAWNWSPGSWLYFVYREDREYDRAVVSIPGDRTFRIKATWLMRVGA